MKNSIFIFLFVICSLLSGICYAQWVQVSNGMGNVTVRSLAYSGNNIFAGTEYFGVYLSTNNGTTWTQTSLNNGGVTSLAVNGSNIFAGTNFGVYLSTDNGTNWIQTSLDNRDVISLAVNGNNIFAGTIDNGVYFTINNGINWTQTSLNNKTIYSLKVKDSNIFCSDTDGVYISTNNGVSWISRNEGFSYQISAHALAISDNYIFAGSYCNAVWRRNLSEIIGIKPISNNVPKMYILSQNYPNPFNPTTYIRFDIPELSFTQLVIYDILGREVATLVNEHLKPGTYEVDWDASKYASGVYFYILTTESFSNTKRMVLIK